MSDVLGYLPAQYSSTTVSCKTKQQILELGVPVCRKLAAVVTLLLGYSGASAKLLAYLHIHQIAWKYLVQVRYQQRLYKRRERKERVAIYNT
jgi:hypothetical protein